MAKWPRGFWREMTDGVELAMNARDVAGACGKEASSIKLQTSGKRQERSLKPQASSFREGLNLKPQDLGLVGFGFRYWRFPEAWMLRLGVLTLVCTLSATATSPQLNSILP